MSDHQCSRPPVKKFWHLFTLRKSCSPHHRELVRFRISDRKFVNQTTEMILWSMILPFPPMSEPFQCSPGQTCFGTHINCILGLFWQNLTFCSSYNWWLKLTLILTWALTYVPWTCSIAATTPSFVNFVQLLQCSYHVHLRIYGLNLSPEIIDPIHVTQITIAGFL